MTASLLATTRLATTLFGATVLGVTLLAAPALAQDMPLRGESRIDQFTLADGYALTRFARLRTRSANLRFADTPPGTFPALTLRGPGGCVVRLEDRNTDGHFETELTKVNGTAAGRCPTTDATYARTTQEAGADAAAIFPALRDCRFQTTRDYRVQCQPTRFGANAGEPFDVIAGFADRFGRAATGRPTDLAWHDGLLVLDGHSGIVYKLVASDPADDTALPNTIIADNRPAKPVLLRESILRDADRPVSKEYQKILDDRESTFGKRKEVNPPAGAPESDTPPEE